MTTTSQFVLFGSNSSFWNNASLLSLVIDSNQLKKGVGTKKFLYFSFLRQEKICLMRYSRQALFPPSTRATLKSFGDVFAKSSYECHCKWDGTIGIASAGFQVVRQHCKDSILKEQRICLLLWTIFPKPLSKTVVERLQKVSTPFSRLRQLLAVFSRKSGESSLPTNGFFQIG